MRISIKKLLLVSFLIVILLPAYFSNSVINLLNNILSLLVVVTLAKNKYRPNLYIIVVVLYYADLIIMTTINGNLTPNIFVYNVKIVAMIAFIHFMYRKNQYSTIKIVTTIVVLFVLIDFITIVIWPNGLYVTTTDYSEWNSAKVPNWLLGNKNNRIVWELLAISLAKISYDTGILRKISLYFIMLISVLAILLTRSGTSIVAVTILCCSIIFQKILPVGKNSKKFFLIGYCVLLGLIMFGNIGFLAPFVEGVLGKDLTFTGRASTWNMVTAYIIQKPIFGWGNIGSSQAMQMISKASAVNAHSQWLQVLLQGGVVELVIFVLLIMLSAKYFDKVCNESKLFYFGGLLSLLLVMIFEVKMGNLVLMFLFFMMEGSKKESETVLIRAREERT